MRTTHKLNLTRFRTVMLLGVICAIFGLALAINPTGRALADSQPKATSQQVQAYVDTASIQTLLDRHPASIFNWHSAPASFTLLPAGATFKAHAAMTAAMMFDNNEAITLSANPPSGSTVAVGSLIAYTTTVTNPTGVEGNAQVTLNVPAGTTFQSIDLGGTSVFAGCVGVPAAGTPGPLAIVCAQPVFLPAQVSTFTIVAQVVAAAGSTIGPVINSYNDADGPGFNSNGVVHVVIPASAPPADLILDKYAYTNPTLPSGQVIAGGTTLPGPANALAIGTSEILYRVDVANAGPNDAFGVFALDDIPANTEYVPGSLNFTVPPTGAVAGSFPSNFICDGDSTTGPQDPPSPGKQLQCKPDDAATGAFLAAGRLNVASGVKSFTFKLRVPANVPQGAVINNTAVVLSAQPDPNGANNDAAKTLQTAVQAQTDLGITKVTSNPTPTAGGAAFSYTLTVTNNGPSDAKNVVVSDPLPPGVIFQNVANVGPGGFICAGPPVGTNGTVTCTSGNFPAGSVNTITIVAQIVANVASGVRTNTATVSSSTTEVTPNTLPNTASVQQNIVVDAPLSITKSGPATICAGETYTYHVTVNNGGSSTALNATISDPLPANTTFLSLAGTGAFANSCSHNGGTPGTVTCAAVDIPSGQSTLDVTVRLSPSAPNGALANTATITTAGTGTIAVGTSTSTATVVHCTDLEITKSDSPDAVKAGEVINYTIRLRNIGPSILGANEATVTDTFNAADFAQLTPGTLTANGFTCAGAPVTQVFNCTNTQAIPPGSSLTITFQVTVKASFNGGLPGQTVDNLASVNFAAGVTNVTDPNPNNNSSETHTPIGPSADLAIQKNAQTLLGALFDAQVTAGGSISASNPPSGTGEILYTINYQNNGLGDAANVHIRDVLPANTFAGNPIVTSPGLTCNPIVILGVVQLDCTPNAGAFGANAAGTLPAGATGSLTVRVRVGANVLEGTAIKNVATINSEQAGANPATPDPNGGNNTSNETQNRVRAQVDLAIVKAQTVPAAGQPVIAGNNITYTLTVTNNGPSDAQNVVVKDTLPPNVSFVSASSTGNKFVCAPDNGNAGVINCTAATLFANDTNIQPPRPDEHIATITIVGKVASSVPNGNNLTNTATVASSTNEDAAQLANNTSSVTTPVTTNAVVVATKSDLPDPVLAGTNLTYTITVTNNGPSDAPDFRLSDPLPAGTTLVSFNGTGILSAAGACRQEPPPNANIVTCGAPGNNTLNLPAGASVNLTIIAKVLSSTIQKPAPNNIPSDPTTPNGQGILVNIVTVTWQDSNGVVGPTVLNTTTATQKTTVRHESDVAITKVAPDEVIAGQRMDYKLYITNFGPSDILGDNPPVQAPAPADGRGSLTIVDQLPVGVTPVDLSGPPNANGGLVISGPGGITCTYDQPNNRVICRNAAGTPGNIPVGSVITIVFKVTTSPAIPDGCNLNNCATAYVRGDVAPNPDPGVGTDANATTGTPEYDPNPGNNTSCDSTTVRTSADLGVTKTAVPVTTPAGSGLTPVALPTGPGNVPTGGVVAGGFIQYNVPFGNAGPSDAVNVTLTDIIPANTGYVGAFTGAANNTFTAATTFTVVADTTPTNPILLTCTVTPSGPNGSAQINCVPPNRQSPLPICQQNQVAVLPAGYTGTLSFFVRVNQSVSGGTIVSNPARITSSANGGTPATPDPNTGNNASLPTQTVVVAASQLSITKIVQSAVTSASNPNQTGPIGPASVSNGTGTTGTAVLPGTYMTYRITVQNNGPSDVSNIRVTDILPSGLEATVNRVLGVKYISVTPQSTSGVTFTCNPPTGVNPNNNPQGNGGTLQCTAPLMANGASATIDIVVFIDPATKATPLIDNASIDATVNNFNQPTVATTVLNTPIAPTSDLALTKTHTPDPVVAGTSFNYTITLNNNGPSTAQMVNLVDTLPPFQKVTAIQVQQTPDGNGAPNLTCNATPAVGTPGNTTSVTCTAAELPPNKKPDGTVNPAGTVRIILTVLQDPFTPQPTPTQYQNCVTATSMSTDPIPANNTNVCDTVNITFFSPLTGAKVDVPDPVIAGNNLTYTITGSPQGPSAALNFTIQDALPLGTVFVSAVASPGATLTTPAVNANGTVTAIWNAAGGTPGGLTGPGVVRTLTIVVRVCPDFQQIRNLTDVQMCVPNLTNTANLFSDTPPNLANIPTPATSVTTVQAQSDLAISKTAVGEIQYSTSLSPSNITYTITFSNGGPSNASGVTVTDVLPKGFTVVGTPTSTVPGTVFTTTTTAGITTVVANLGVLGAANQCQLTRPTSGTIVIVARVPIKHPSVSVTNQATIASTNCLPETGTLAVLNNANTGYPPNITPGTGMLANNRAFATTNIVPPGTTPGKAYPALSEASDQKEGSILFYPIYTSDAVNGNTQNTRIAITNTSSTERATIHLFAVDGSSCAVLDAFICLTPNQTTIFLASDFDPGNTGYLVAVAVEDATGLPRVFNELIGDEYVKFSTGHAANLAAESIAASMMFPAGVDPNVTTTTLRFDGLNYNRLPRILSSDNIPSPADGNSTMLIVDRVGGDFTTTGGNIGNITGQLYDDAETPYSFTANLGVCQYRKILDNTFPRTFTPFNRILTAGRSGWMKFWSVNDWALLGAQINFNPNAATNSNAFNQGHNLHHLTLTDAATIVVPVFIPGC